MRKIGKVLKYLAVTGAVVFVVSFCAVAIMGEYRRNIPRADAVIILGAAINTPALYNRSLEGLRLFADGKTNVLVLSGGRISDKDLSEAEYMRKTILKNSAETPPLILEQESHSTYENIKNSKKLIPEAKSVVVVSDTYHLARGVLMAKAVGFEEVYWSAPDSASYYPAGELAYHYFRETVAIIAYIPKFIFH